MHLMHIPELLSWTRQIPTSGQDCNCFAAAILPDLISTTHPCLRTFTHKRTRITLVPLQAHSGRVERLKWHNLPRAKQLQHESPTGQEESLTSLLHSNFPNPIHMIRETEDFRALGPHHPVKNRVVPTKNHLAIHQFESNIRHHQR
jgi:hypothetical protein